MEKTTRARQGGGRDSRILADQAYEHRGRPAGQNRMNMYNQDRPFDRNPKGSQGGRLREGPGNGWRNHASDSGMLSGGRSLAEAGRWESVSEGRSRTAGRRESVSAGRSQAAAGQWESVRDRRSQAPGRRQSMSEGRSRAAAGQESMSGKSRGSGQNAMPGQEAGFSSQPHPARARSEAASQLRSTGSRAGTNFLVQGSILAAAGIIVRLIGMFYRIPLANYIGDEGNGYYSAAYNIYSILLILSSYSLPVAVSKMVSARLARRQYHNIQRILRTALFYATVVGGAGFCILWFGADLFARQVIKMPYSAYALRVLAPTIWIMAYLGVLRGYFQGYSSMVPTAVSQIFEQIVNAVISLLAAKTLFDLGVKSNLVYDSTEYSYAFGAAGGALGTGAGALTALVLLFLLLLICLPGMRRKIRKEPRGGLEGYGTITFLLFFTVVPIIVSSALYNSSTVIDNILYGQVMDKIGESDVIAAQWGIYSGKYHLLFNIPVAVANSLSSSLIPSLSRAAAQKDRKEVLKKTASAIRFSMIIAIPSAVGLTVLAAPVCNLLFPGRDNTMLIRMTKLGSSAVVVYSLSTVTNAVLQGINRMKLPIYHAIASLTLHSGILYVMLRVFRMGIYGVLYANILFAFFMCVLNARAIRRCRRYRQEIRKTFLIPAIASGFMGGAAFGTYQLCFAVLKNNMYGTLMAIMVAAGVYFVLLMKLGGVNARELRSMPGGTRLLRIARRLHLM